MPSIRTKHFGVVPFEEEDVFEFPHGLPGFEDEQRFLCIERPAYRPVVFLQSVVQPDLCFITVPARSVDPAYELEVAVEERTVLGIIPPTPGPWEQSLACLAIVCLPAEGTATANLLGPVVLSRETRKGVQAIRDDCRYSALTPLQPAVPEQNSVALSPVSPDSAERHAPAERHAEV